MSSSSVPAVDVVHPDDIAHLAAHRGPALSVFIPTARHGPETLQGPTRLRNLVRSVTSDAEAAFGADTTSQLLAPVLALADDSAVWQHQADGLAVFATPTEHRQFRLPIPFAEDAAIGERFRLRPMVGYLAGNEHAVWESSYEIRQRGYLPTGVLIALIVATRMPRGLNPGTSLGSRRGR